MNLTGRPVMQKQPRIEMPKLRKSAEHAPCCMNPDCSRPNHDKTCVLSHSNWQEHGKGVGYKAHDIFGAILCQACHDFVDGRTPLLGIANDDTRREVWARAHRATLVWWINEGYVKV
jgi:hypothetical protein